MINSSFTQLQITSTRDSTRTGGYTCAYLLLTIAAASSFTGTMPAHYPHCAPCQEGTSTYIRTLITSGHDQDLCPKASVRAVMSIRRGVEASVNGALLLSALCSSA